MQKHGENCSFYVGVGVASDNLIKAHSCKYVSSLVKGYGDGDVDNYYDEDRPVKIQAALS